MKICKFCGYEKNIADEYMKLKQYPNSSMIYRDQLLDDHYERSPECVEKLNLAVKKYFASKEQSKC